MQLQVTSSAEMTRDALRLLLYTATLLGLCVYSATVGPRHVVTIVDALANPVAFAGSASCAGSRLFSNGNTPGLLSLPLVP
jgi:hypothetical protein